jgi:phosphoribosylformylglycinamidine (FGAM) synthase-like enzyme
LKPNFLEQRGRHHHALGLLLEALGQFEQRRHALEHRLADVLGRRVELPAHQLRQVAVERAHRRADAHVVVVQDDQQVAVGHAGVVERLEGHAGGHGAVADDGHRVAVLALDPAASAMPSAAEMLVLECAVPKVSYSLSARCGKPERPPSWRRWPCARAGRSGSCADRSGGPRPTPGGRAGVLNT